MPQAIFANIIWNRKGWTEIDKISDPRYEKLDDNPGHESLNFDFDKKDIDTDEWVYGYFQRTSDPVKFAKKGLIFFYSLNLKKEPFIVGIYGQAEILGKEIYENKEFQNNQYWTNIRAKKDYSLNFPEFSNDFVKEFAKERKLGRIGFAYLKDDQEMELLSEIMRHCKKSGDETQVSKMKRLYEYYASAKSRVDKARREWEAKTRSSKTEIVIPKKFLVDFKLNESDLKVLENPKDIRDAQNLLKKIMSAATLKQGKIRIGLPNKLRTEEERYPYEPFEAYWIESYGIWWASEEIEKSGNTKYRNLFGVNEPKWEETKKQFRNHQVCEINQSLSGSSKIIGAFVTDGDGNIFLATERIRGVFGRGQHINAIESIFSKRSRQYSISHSEKNRDLFIISKLNSEQALSQISFFIQNTQNFKKQFELIPDEITLEELDQVVDEKMPLDASSDFSARGGDSTVHSRGSSQNEFKQILVQEYGAKCAFCEFDQLEYLIGAHIVPYNVMREEDPKNAMNPANGILLCKLCDIAFENGDIILQENHDIAVGQKLKESKNKVVLSWQTAIKPKISIKSDSCFTPKTEFIQKKIEMNKGMR